jgi:hypothetical protein
MRDGSFSVSKATYFASDVGLKCLLYKVVEIEGAGFLRVSFNGYCPRPRFKVLRVLKGVGFIGSELVVVVVGRYILEAIWRLVGTEQTRFKASQFCTTCFRNDGAHRCRRQYGAADGSAGANEGTAVQVVLLARNL